MESESEAMNSNDDVKKMVNSNDNDDDEIRLPEDTLKILNEFLAEKTKKERLEEEYLNEENGKDAVFEENWQLSQFWYNDKTKEDLTKICQKVLKPEFNVALLSCPSLYRSIKNVHDKVKIFEYDERFKSFGNDFVYYDFNEASDQHLSDYHKKFDIIIADPPFLSEECVTKISIIIKNLMKTNNTKIMFCSGCIIEKLIIKYLKLYKSDYKPEHERNLGNDFVLYTNFDIN